MRRLIVLSAFIAGLVLSALLMAPAHPAVVHAQPPTATPTPTATAEALGEDEAYRWDIMTVPSNNVVQLEGNFGRPPRPCIKDVGISQSKHLAGLVGYKRSGMASLRDRVEIGFLKANWGASGLTGRSFLYTYCSFCTKLEGGTPQPDEFRIHMDAKDIASSSQFRIEVTNTSIKWFFNNGGAGETKIREFDEEAIDFNADSIIVGGNSSDTRNDIGTHLTELVQYKIGIGAWNNMLPIPSQYLQGYFAASGAPRYYTSWLSSSRRQWLFDDQEIGRGVQLCP